jgi:hypothetical protein
MNRKALICGLTAALLATGACSASNTNKPTASTNTTASTAATPATTPVNNQPATAGNQDFTLVNNTGVEIDKVFISPHDSNDWEEDILGRDTLPSGESVEIKFHRDEKAPIWDLRIEDSKGNAITWENLNLMQIAKLTLNYKDGKATAIAE